MNGFRTELSVGINSHQRNSVIDQYVKSEQYVKDSEKSGVENVNTEKTSASPKAENESEQQKNEKNGLFSHGSNSKNKSGTSVYNSDGSLKSKDEKNAAETGKTDGIAKTENNNEKENVDGQKTGSHSKKDGFDGDCPECECEACRRRRYMDSSNDSCVSFQNPTKIDQNMVHARVMAHEMEHVRHEQINAKAENRKIISQSVRIKNSICPECGKTYVSGGVTRTVSRPDLSDFRKLFHVGADPALPKDEFFETMT